LPVSFARLGRLEVLGSEKAVERAREEAVAACAHWPSFGTGAVMAYLDETAAKELAPGLAAAPFGALHCRATAQVDVAELVAALKAVCIKAGVMIREGIKVPNAHAPGAVLVTAGAWTRNLLSDAAKIRPVKGQGIALRPSTMPPLIVKSGTIYLVPWAQKIELLLGSTTEPDAGFDETPTPAARESLLVGAARTLPALANSEVLRHWAGLRPQNSAKGHPPVMARVEPNLYVCAGHFKTGIGMAPASARRMVQMMLEG
jgi:glycine/D-amino acid oxidase-like deaminating enzyme